MASTKEMNEKMMYELDHTTFGVEIEMTGITREAAARVAATILPNSRVWEKGTSYHKWTCTDDRGRDWDFVYDSSIHSTGNDLMKCELNTPPLTYNRDMETLQKLIRALRHAGAIADAEHECGIHVHVSGKRHTYETVKNFINLMYSNDELVRKSLGIDPGRSERWCKPIEYDLVSAVKNVRSMDELEDAWYGTYSPWQSRTNHYNNSRYHILNLHRYFSTLGKSKNTI
ncbi:MAG: amidoligase family protein, partial [Lachnospiraceae bacterium]|nr:amidoligase family protein [Lachnospiraceae bacterium]